MGVCRPDAGTYHDGRTGLCRTFGEIQQRQTGVERSAMSLKLAERAAIVTGGASGMGEATARRFASEGASVLIADVQIENGRRVAHEIREAGGRATFVKCDVSDGSDVQAAIDACIHDFGSLHVLVNVAGIASFKPFHEFSEADWNRMLGVNLKGMFLTSKFAIPYLTKNSRSYIVNIGSTSCFVGDAGESIYSISKGGVMMLSKSIALEYAAQGLRCNCICPGITDTPMLRQHVNTTADPEATLAARLRRVPMGVAVQPDDIAKCALFLSCEDSACITGTHILVDGGYLAAAEWTCPEKTAFTPPP
jgi:NAD(P)-dependent dehydrogenase (short-subunit alcohol dehydrogenase family)